MSARTFEDSQATRERVPLMLGLVGPSGGGKTMSALRLATGIQRITGGDIFMVDTEARRSLHYAADFKFRHVPFGAPFGPLDYLAAIEHCVRKGARVVIVDSMSHEHEGPGGVLEAHDVETKRLAALWKTSESATQMTAWAKPKAERRRMINSILQLPVSAIFCFRAKEKLKIVRGKDPQQMGFMPIAGEEFIYEMAMNCLLLPKADGVPCWDSPEIGERATMKCPKQFRHLFESGGPLSEDIGEHMARWAEGDSAPRSAGVVEMLADIALADDAGLKAIEPRFKAARPSMTKTDIDAIGSAVKQRRATLATEAKQAARASGFDPESGEVPPGEEPTTRQPGEE